MPLPTGALRKAPAIASTLYGAQGSLCAAGVPSEPAVPKVAVRVGQVKV